MSRSPQERWRLILGRYSDRRFGGCLSKGDCERDGALDYLYGREYDARGIKPDAPDRRGSLDSTRLRALDWLARTRELFPEPVFEALQAEAVERYKLTELLSDPTVLEDVAPSPALLRTVLSFKDRAQPELRAELDRIARKIIDDIMERIRNQMVRAFSGRRNRHRRSPLKSAANFDARATIRMNLRNWDAERQRVVADQLRFISRQKRHLDWTVILCVDQSGSMSDSLIFSALMAAVMAGLPGIRVKMVLFDTSVVDVSDQIDDPLSLLLSVQLGGGTDIGHALRNCEGLVEQPTRTVLAVISDFYEGASPRQLLASVARLNEARVRLIGIAALNDEGRADFDRVMAQKLADLGMSVAAQTPNSFADWLAEVLE